MPHISATPDAVEPHPPVEAANTRLALPLRLLRVHTPDTHMKLAVLALDYDGTLAVDGVLDPHARDAIAAARSNGILVLLVTGRILQELRQVAGDLHFVDGVVAENGGVVHFPASGYTTVLAPPIPPAFVPALTNRGIDVSVGETLLDADAGQASRILEVIHQLELPLVLVFNRGRVMTLPQGVTKATGLRAALEMLRRSGRNTLAVGDAENDHELLRLAEVGAAVAWGSASLRASADIVIAGRTPRAAADYIQKCAEEGWLPEAGRERRRIRLGHTEDGHEFALSARGRNILIAGDAKSGKSWLGGLICEQLILHGYSVCVIDAEGDYRSLEALPGVTVLGGDDPPPNPRQLLRAFRYPDRSVVVDLSHLPQDAKVEQVRALLPALNVMRRKTGLPHRIVVDEAHYFLHDTAARNLLDLQLNGYTVLTYCASRLPPELLGATEVLIVTCESNPAEVDALFRCYGNGDPATQRHWADLLGRLQMGQAVGVPLSRDTASALRMFTLMPRLTPHVRHREKYVDVPVTEGHAFVFGSYGQLPQRRVRTLREFVAELESAPPASLMAYLRRGDFSRWIGGVFGDHALADELRRFEDRYGAAPSGQAAGAIANAVRGRYDLTDTEWERAPGVYASAAVERVEESEPCPG